MCEQGRQLLLATNEAGLDFSKALSNLLFGDMESPLGRNYDSLRQAVQEAHKRSMAANRALEAHLQEHACDVSRLDLESAKRQARLADVA